MTMWTRFRRWLAPVQAMPPLILPEAVDDGSERAAIDPVETNKPVVGARRIIARAFDSTHPVASRRELFGREEELEGMTEAALDLRQHLLIHGPRGSGKTSLVHVFGDYADEIGTIVIYMACEAGASFAQTIRPFLNYLPGAALGPGVRGEFERRVTALSDDAGPRVFVDVLHAVANRQVLFVLDEFDRITDGAVVGEIASFMKLLSDTHSKVQLVLVGIAHNVTDVIAGHPSLRRHMQITSLNRIAAPSVDAIIDHGAQASGVRFGDEARRIIARAACGSPYHVRLFARFMAMAALRDNSNIVDEYHAVAGLDAAYGEWAKSNEDDAGLFGRLAANAANAERLESIARMAGHFELFDPAELARHGFAAGELDGAVVQDQRIEGKSLFQDSTAPQFLIALLQVNEYQRGRAGEGMNT